MPSALLYYIYGAVMLASVGCFVQAFRRRFVTPIHKRWALTGMALSIGGIVVVILLTYVFGWRVDHRYSSVVRIHRMLALGATALVLLIGYTGWRRSPIHKRLYVVFFPLYAATVLTALIGYQP